jgi:hypothetical protein
MRVCLRARAQELFEAHKAAAGFPEATLVLKDD